MGDIQARALAAVNSIRAPETASESLCRKRFCVIRTMVTYRVFMATALIIIGLLASGLASNVVSEDNFQIQSSRLISTNLGTLDVAQNEKLSAAAVHPIGFEMVKSLMSSSVEATEVPARSREEDNSCQLSCTFLL